MKGTGSPLMEVKARCLMDNWLWPLQRCQNISRHWWDGPKSWRLFLSRPMLKLQMSLSRPSNTEQRELDFAELSICSSRNRGSGYLGGSSVLGHLRVGRMPWMSCSNFSNMILKEFLRRSKVSLWSLDTSTLHFMSSSLILWTSKRKWLKKWASQWRSSRPLSLSCMSSIQCAVFEAVESVSNTRKWWGCNQRQFSELLKMFLAPNLGSRSHWLEMSRSTPSSKRRSWR